MSDDDKSKLLRCSVESCQAMCCYDGVYLLEGEEQLIKSVVEAYPDQFSHLEGKFITDGFWRGEYYGRKTSTAPFRFNAPDFPPHFSNTRCVFADAKGFCSLEKTARDLGIHKWTFKPTACWLFPLRITDNKLAPPPINCADDPEREDAEYPGYTTFTRCGRHSPQGSPWYEALAEELSYFEKAGALPPFGLKGRTLEEVIELAKWA